MARLHLPAVAVGLLLFIGAGVAGLLAFFALGGRGMGGFWAAAVFVGVLVTALIVGALRRNNASRSEQP